MNQIIYNVLVIMARAMVRNKLLSKKERKMLKKEFKLMRKHSKRAIKRIMAIRNSADNIKRTTD